MRVTALRPVAAPHDAAFLCEIHNLRLSSSRMSVSEKTRGGVCYGEPALFRETATRNGASL